MNRKNNESVFPNYEWIVSDKLSDEGGSPEFLK